MTSDFWYGFEKAMERLIRREFAAVLSCAIDDNALAIGPRQIDYMTQTLFDTVDLNQDGVVSFEELQTMLEKSPEWIVSLQIS